MKHKILITIIIFSLTTFLLLHFLFYKNYFDKPKWIEVEVKPLDNYPPPENFKLKVEYGDKCWTYFFAEYDENLQPPATSTHGLPYLGFTGCINY